MLISRKESKPIPKEKQIVYEKAPENKDSDWSDIAPEFEKFADEPVPDVKTSSNVKDKVPNSPSSTSVSSKFGATQPMVTIAEREDTILKIRRSN